MRLFVVVGLFVAGCVSNQSANCELSTFQDYCDGDSRVYCSDSGTAIGTVVTEPCAQEHMTCIQGTGFTGCVYQKQVCDTTMFAPMCIANGAKVVCKEITPQAAYPVVVDASECMVASGDGGK